MSFRIVSVDRPTDTSLPRYFYFLPVFAQCLDPKTNSVLLYVGWLSWLVEWRIFSGASPERSSYIVATEAREFRVGDRVRCRTSRKPSFYKRNWTEEDLIKEGDILTIKRIDPGRWESKPALHFHNKVLRHASSLFERVIPQTHE